MKAPKQGRPVLNGLEGRHSGSIPEYSYTDANKNSGLTWNEATFKDYIKDPRAKIPNTKMIFPGIKNEKGSRRPVGLPQTVRSGRQQEVDLTTSSRSEGDDRRLTLVKLAMENDW